MEKKILILGDVFLDIFEETKSIKISPERPVPVLNPLHKTFLLGGAANVANNVKSIGANPYLISKLSNDNTSKEIIKLLKRSKIDFKIFLNKKYSSPIKHRIVEKDHQFLRLDKEEETNLWSKHSSLIVKFIKKNIDKFDALILSDYAKGFLTKDLIKQSISIFKKNKKKIFTDPKQYDISLYRGSDFICPNILEFKKLLKHKNLTFDRKSIKRIFNLSKVKAFIVTKGSIGVSIYMNNEKQINISQENINVYDVTGAGDSFISFFTFFYTKKIDLINSVKLACYACKKIVQKKHTSVLQFDELKQLINNYCLENTIDIELKIKLWNIAKFKIGVTNGCFDILHSGHLQLFSKSKNYCDKLIVLINSDKSIRKLKGQNRPINNLKTRIKLMKMIKGIDEILPFEDLTPLKLIKKISPDLLFKGSDYTKKSVIGYEFLKKNGGTVKIIKKFKNYSSTNILNKNN